MKAYCKNCQLIQPSSFRLGKDAVTGAHYEDLCCDSCHFIVATIQEREALAQLAPEPPSEWALIKNILDEHGLQAISFVADWKAAQPAQPPLPAQSDHILDASKMVQPAQQPVDDVRGFLAARLTCWHRLTQKESNELVALFEVKPQPRPWVGVTHQQTKDCMAAWDGKDAYVLCRAIEAKLKEKNT